MKLSTSAFIGAAVPGPARSQVFSPKTAELTVHPDQVLGDYLPQHLRPVY